MLPLWLLLRYTRKWKDTINWPQALPSSFKQMATDTGSSAASVARTTKDDSDVRPAGQKRAKKDDKEQRNGLADSRRVMAEESRFKRIVSENALVLHKEHHEHVLLREERIMSRDTSQLCDMARRNSKKRT